MKKVQVMIEKSLEDNWWATSPDSPGFFAYGDTKEEVITNAKDALSIFLNLEEKLFELVVTEK